MEELELKKHIRNVIALVKLGTFDGLQVNGIVFSYESLQKLTEFVNEEKKEENSEDDLLEEKEIMKIPESKKRKK